MARKVHQAAVVLTERQGCQKILQNKHTCRLPSRNDLTVTQEGRCSAFRRATLRVSSHKKHPCPFPARVLIYLPANIDNTRAEHKPQAFPRNHQVNITTTKPKHQATLELPAKWAQSYLASTVWSTQSQVVSWRS